jgi:hypothetical protein
MIRRAILTASLLALVLTMFAVTAAQPKYEPMGIVTTIMPVVGSYDPPTALVLLTIYDPWQMVLGSDMPRFALYDDGQVIYTHQNDEGEWEILTAMLTPSELDRLLARMDIGDEFFALDDYYEGPMITDQLSNTLRVWDEERGTKTVGVYGDVSLGEARELAPDAFLHVYDVAVGYTNPDAETWLPEKFEVMLWPYETSEATRWPADWPDLNSRDAVERDDDQWSIYLDIDEYERFLALAEDANAFRLGGKTWAFGVRFPYPHEVVWPTN